MKRIIEAKRTPAIIMAAILLAGILLLAMPVFGAGQTNLAIQTTGEIVSPGETITVTISNGPMTVSMVTGGFSFDTRLFYVSSIRTGSNAPEIVSTTEEANAYGTVGFASLGASDTYHDAGTYVIADLVAKTPGVSKLTLYEDSDGTDGFSSEAAGVITERIRSKKEAAPANDAGRDAAGVPGADGGIPGADAGTGTNTGAATAAGTNRTGSNGEGTKAIGTNKNINGNDDPSGPGEAVSGSASEDQKKITPESRPVWPYVAGAGVTLAAVIVVFLIILKMKNRGKRTYDTDSKADTDGADKPAPNRAEEDSDGNEESSDKSEEEERGEES